MPDYAEVAGVASAYNSMGNPHNSTSPLYDSCGAYATTSLIGTTNIYHQSQYDPIMHQHHTSKSLHYNNILNNDLQFVFPEKKASSVSLNNHNNTSNNNNGGKASSAGYGIRNRLMKMNITENKMDVLLINNLGHTNKSNSSVNSIQKPSPLTTANPTVPPTPNLGSTRRNHFLMTRGNNGINLSKSSKTLFQDEPPLCMLKSTSYLDRNEDSPSSSTDDADDDSSERGTSTSDGMQKKNRGDEDNTNNNCSSNNRTALFGDNQSLSSFQNNNVNSSIISGSVNSNNNSSNNIGKNNTNKSSKSLNSAYHIINHRKNGGYANGKIVSGNSPPVNGLLHLKSDSVGANGGGYGKTNGHVVGNGTKKSFSNGETQVNGYMKSFGKTDKV